MQVSSCKACDGIGQQELFMHEGYPVRRCHSCGLVFLDPQPSDEILSKIYSAEYFLESPDVESQDHVSQIKRRTARLYLDAIMQYGGARNGTLLEVGCGKGDLLAEGLARGYEVHGLDLSPHAAQAANRRLGRDVVTCATIEQASLPANYFDVCVCADVIEHTRDPIEFLAQVRQVMKPDGVLLLVTPTLDS
ncbi:MAG: class I SAM-dependent methyltransferase, partial [Nitrospirae bacterium]|nr:class I SAM-dependent methyltransferase [Nitrospirota bacterium]